MFILLFCISIFLPDDEKVFVRFDDISELHRRQLYRGWWKSGFLLLFADFPEFSGRFLSF